MRAARSRDFTLAGTTSTMRLLITLPSRTMASVVNVFRMSFVAVPAFRRVEHAQATAGAGTNVEQSSAAPKGPNHGEEFSRPGTTSTLWPRQAEGGRDSSSANCDFPLAMGGASGPLTRRDSSQSRGWGARRRDALRHWRRSAETTWLRRQFALWIGHR